jgi:hypothetical protein
MFHEEHTSQNELLLEKETSQNELLLEKETSFTSIYVHEIMQPARYANSQNTLKHICYSTSTCFSHLRPPSGILVKVKFTLEQAMKAQSGRRGTALLFP